MKISVLTITLSILNQYNSQVEIMVNQCLRHKDQNMQFITFKVIGFFQLRLLSTIQKMIDKLITFNAEMEMEQLIDVAEGNAVKYTRWESKVQVLSTLQPGESSCG